MPVEVDCPCGQRLAVSEVLAGLSVHCRGCGSSVAVPRLGGSAPPPAKPQAAAPPPPPPPRAPAPPPKPLAAALPPTPPPAPAAPSVSDLKKGSGEYDPNAFAPKPEKEEGTFSGGVIGGLGMMLVAAIWLIVGLMLDRLFFYPIIMFFIGMGTLIKSMSDNE